MPEEASDKLLAFREEVGLFGPLLYVGRPARSGTCQALDHAGDDAAIGQFESQAAE